jgi:hypothetical protein
MPRPLRLSGISLTKHGRKRKIVIQLPIEKGLIGITTRNNKQYLLIGRNGYYVERVIVFNPITEQIETDFTTDVLDYWHDWIPLKFSDNGSFVLANGTYFKYDTATKTYQTIQLGVSTVLFTKWLSDRFIVFLFMAGASQANIYDLNGNLLNQIPLPSTSSRYVDIGDKVMFIQNLSNKLFTFDVNTYEIKQYTLPFTLFTFYGIAGQRIKGTNKVHIYSGFEHKLYRLDLDTEELTLIKNFSTEDFVQYGFFDSWFSNDGKIVFLVYYDILYQNILETWAYNTETDEIRKIPLTQWPIMVLEDGDSRIFLIVDTPFFYVPFIYDYNNDKVIGAISNFGINPLYTDGKILMMV